MRAARVGRGRPAVALVLTAALLALSGCPAGAPDPSVNTPGALASSVGVGGESRAGSPPGSARARPDPQPDLADVLAGVSLPELDGEAALDLDRLGRPAVINLWASWCAPCRAELPALQGLADSADAAGVDLIVLGVVTGDARWAAASFASDLGLGFPSVFDETSRVQRALGRPVLPLTLFVDASGRVRHLHQTGALTLATATDLVRTQLGVAMP